MVDFLRNKLRRKKVFGYYFNPEIKFDPKASHGAFESGLAGV